MIAIVLFIIAGVTLAICGTSIVAKTFAVLIALIALVFSMVIMLITFAFALITRPTGPLIRTRRPVAGLITRLRSSRSIFQIQRKLDLEHQYLTAVVVARSSSARTANP